MDLASLPPPEQRLCIKLRDHPRVFNNRYTAAAEEALLEALFRSLSADNDEYLQLLFPSSLQNSGSERWKLSAAQGAVSGAEYTEAARGSPCGHIFKAGETQYRCETCALDETCVLCSKCFHASLHEGHNVSVSVSQGNTGCCDCGDHEAWKTPVRCGIHSVLPSSRGNDPREPLYAQPLPSELREAISATIARAFDYVCDVIACSPEQLRGVRCASPNISTCFS